MKRLFSVIAVISVIAAAGMVMTACSGNEQSGEAASAAQTTVQATAAQQTTAAQETTATPKSGDDKKSSDTESKASKTESKTSKTESKTSKTESKTSKTESKSSKTESKTSEASDKKSDSDSGKPFAGISEEDAKVMALLDLVTEDASVESCKQGKDKDGADCWVIILKDADNDRYISYVNSEGSTTLPYTE